MVKIAVGHGLQNYTCANSSAPTVATGALAALYDVTALYPGTAGTGLDADAWNTLPSTILWTQDIPLNLQDTDAANPGSHSTPNVVSESLYGANVANPFPSPATDLSVGSVTASFLGHHYFDINGTPTFDLVAAGLLGSVSKTGDVKPPAGADAGLLNSGAVDWLQLRDTGKGVSKGVTLVYRVLTAGGASEACSAVNATSGSVPYAAFYWFFA